MTRIRWDEVPEGNPPVVRGHVGLLGEPLFEIHPPDPLYAYWVLTSSLPGWHDRQLTGDAGAGPEPLKDQAEGWLDAFVTSIGAVFPPSSDGNLTLRYETASATPAAPEISAPRAGKETTTDA